MPVMKYSKTLVMVFLLLFASKSRTDASPVQVRDAGQSEEESGDSPNIAVKTQNAKLDESNIPPPSADDKNPKFKVERSEPPMESNVGDKITKAEGSENSPQTVDLNQQSGEIEGIDQSLDIQGEKSEDTKLGVADPQILQLPSDGKKQKPKEEEITRKINLNDVNSYTADESHIKGRKRETRFSEFLGLPRDASYFFDDHEPFINNNSDNRIGRAAPSRETKSQRSKVRGKENIENDIDDDDEDTEVEEEDKTNEDEYDDEEEVDLDCQPTTVCSSTTTCRPTTTTCRTTTKCTTEYRASTCRTTTEDKCTTKCPKICAKPNRKNIGYPLTTEKTMDWDADKKKLNNKRRKVHSRNTNL